VVIAEMLPYARPAGLVKDFLPGSRSALQRAGLLGAVAGGFALAAALVVIERGGRGLAALGAELVAMGAVALLSWRRVGGFTGDVLGAAGVVGETIGLLVLATR
jgi:adenosylcobinamide-GDP ribazoletransferase